MKQIKLNNHIIAKGKPPFTIAEAGINHNGDIKNALKMIGVAKISGAHAIKFQTFKASELISDHNQKYTYKSQGKKVTESMYDMFKRCELDKEDWGKIKKQCDDEKILFLSTPQNKTDLDLLLNLGITAIKVGSDDFTNLPLIKEYSSTGLPLLLSCGMANLSEISTSLNIVGAFDGYPTILLHTTSQYPTPVKDTNILKLKTLENTFPNIPLGFSDHTQGSLASSLAVSFGACIFEKHFTLDQNLPGPDHWFSENQESLKNWIDSIKKSYLMMGSGDLKPTNAEQKMKILARRSIVALTDIKKDDILDLQNIGIKRPGNGLPPKLFEEIIGKKTTRDLIKNELLKTGDYL
jgi:N,N'-diacetyllegionaminate synthase